MGKTRDLFKKIRDTKGTFHAKTHKTKTAREAKVFIIDGKFALGFLHGHRGGASGTASACWVADAHAAALELQSAMVPAALHAVQCAALAELALWA